MLKVYGFGRVNRMAHGNTRDLRVFWALEEMGLPYEIIGMDHPAHDLDSAAYGAVNPFGQIPAIDDDGVVVTESGAILLYLARKCGKLGGRNIAEEAQVMRWSVAALNSIELPVLASWFVGVMGGKGSKPDEALRGWASMRIAQLDGWLARREFVATDDFTVADVLVTHVLGGGTDPKLLEGHAHVIAYRGRTMERAAWRKVVAEYSGRVEAA